MSEEQQRVIEQDSEAPKTSNENNNNEEKDLFPDLGEEERPTEIESLCVNCEENGLTRILLVKIPFFKEIIVSAFECPHCHYSNNEVQTAGQIAEKGCEYTLRVTKSEDLNRSIVKTDSCSFRIEELDFEIPPNTQKGNFSTLEGIIRRSRDGLEQDQPLRRDQYPEVAQQIDAFIAKLDNMLAGNSFPFTVKMTDLCGNSFIQNPYSPKLDPYLKVHHFTRSQEQDELLGIRPQDYGPTHTAASEKILTAENFEMIKQKLEESAEDLGESVIEMPCECNSCGFPGYVKMHLLDIPYFKEIVIMAFTCDRCGYRTNEVKAGGAISEHGKRYQLRVQTPEDLSRDILKSETASVEIPELELELVAGSLGGKFTTVEGLLRQICDELSKNPFIRGDSSHHSDRLTIADFVKQFQSLLDGGEPFTLVLDDPVGNSYIQNLFAPDPDPALRIFDYVRTKEQDDELGISDMVTEGYYKEEEGTTNLNNNEKHENENGSSSTKQKSKPPVLVNAVVDPNLRLLEISYINPQTEREWLPVLKYGKMISFKNIDSEVVGLADKYKVIFESGHQAIAKLVEPFNYFDREWKNISFLDPRYDETFSPKRAGRKLQGWSEVAAVIVSRILFPHRKLPATLRKISSKELYATWNNEEKGSFSLETYLKNSFPEHDVIISVQAWIKRIVNSPPSVEYFKFLHAPPENPSPVPVIKRKFAGEVSDMLVFDFLIDDHDRHKSHNWVSDEYGNLLFWDNGLAFNHGPAGKSSCVDLLCGPDSWKEHAKKMYSESDLAAGCKKICKFRKETVDRIRSFDPRHRSFTRKFSDIFTEELEKEEIGVFDFNTYYPSNQRFPKVRYFSTDFPLGMDLKILKFLHHVDQCIYSFGAEFVLDPNLY